VADLEIRPTLRFILLGYAAAGAVELAALVWWLLRPDALSMVVWIAASALLLWPLARHLERQRIRCALQGGHLRYQYGIFSTTVKTIPVAKIQDVTVKRSLMQRIWGVGNLRIETAGQASALEIPNVENPARTAEKILAASSG